MSCLRFTLNRAGLALSLCGWLVQTGCTVGGDSETTNQPDKTKPAATPSRPLKQLTPVQVRAAFTEAARLSNDNPTNYYRILLEALNRADISNNGPQIGNAKITPQSLSGPLRTQSFESDEINVISHASVEFQQSLKIFGSKNEILIIGGEPTRVNEFDDCVAVGSSFGWCGSGILVSPNVVLTAAHCFPNCVRRIFIGKNVRKDGKIVEVKIAVPHPGYNVFTKSNDIAVLILKERVAVTPAPIATEAILNAATKLRLVGYGMTNSTGSVGYGIQQMVDVPPIPNSCLADAQRIEYGCNIGVEIVAGAPLLHRDACGGDSGGPAYVDVNGRWYVGGTTSRKTTNSLELCGSFSAYVRSHYYLPWIREVALTNGGISP